MPQIKKRKDSFFGLHFDFHAEPQKCKNVIMGQNLKEEDIRLICREVKPDFIQIDCKGHPGYASYPSKIGNAMPEFAFDTLALWRKVTAEEGVALYMHYSGIYDAKYLSENPLEGVKKADGTYSDTDTSTFGNYLDDLMIPQLLELGGYGVDGVWVDGECWATKVDYCDKALEAFYKETGIDVKDNPPFTKEDPYYYDYLDFCRERFRFHLSKYCNTVHEKYPNMQIASNWAYSEQMPEAPSAPVDFLSGDFSPENSLENAFFSARIIAAQGKPWDLMSWGFRQNWETNGHTNKHSEQLKQESSAVLMLGGAFQNYIMQRWDGSPKLNCALAMKEVAEFCRERKDFCFKTSTLPQTVIFNSTFDHYRSSPYIFSNGDTYKSIKGWVNILSKSGHSFEIREEHNLFPNLDKFPLVIVPEVNDSFEDSTVCKLISYAENGGNLVVSGLKSAKIFADKLNISLEQKNTNNKTNISVDKNFWSLIEENFASVEGGTPLLFASATEDGCDSAVNVASSFDIGKGKIIIIATDIGKGTLNSYVITATEIGKMLLDTYNPIAKITGEVSQFTQINTTEKDGKLLIQILNTSGEHNNIRVSSCDRIIPLYELVLNLDINKKIQKIIWQPDGTELSFSNNNGIYSVALPKLNIYNTVEIQF